MSFLIFDLIFMPVLYRKYRPKIFSEIVGQEHIVKTLTNAISMGMTSHAYLFYGSRGLGKTTTARLLAKAVNCIEIEKSKIQNPKSKIPKEFYEPCNQCWSCREINEGRALDLIEIDAASNRGIDEIRSLKEGVNIVPIKSKYKVYIIDECLTADHLITMADGRVKKISEIKNEEEIASVDLQTGGVVKRKVKNWFKRKTGQIIEIKSPQTFFRCTPAHRLWILRDSEFLLVEANNLRIGDFLLSPVYLPHFQKNNLKPAQLSLLALIQCDGHVSKDSITIQIEIRKDREYFTETAKKGFKAWGLKEKPTIKTTSRGTRLIRVYSKKLKEILINLSCPKGKKSNKIDIPDEVFQAPLESIKAYIDTCFCCEGDIIPFGFPGNINYRLNFSSTSEIFARKLQLLLKKFSIGSNILEIKRKNKKHAILYRSSVSGYNLRLFSTYIGLSLRRKAELLKKYLQEKKEKEDSIPIEKLVLKKREEKRIPYSQLIPFGVYPAIGQHLTRKAVINFMKLGGLPELNKYLKFRYEKIKKIKILNKEEEVYDFTVEETHTFIANGICSSNCHQLTKEASNALLKTLEEPPSHVIFVLCTTEFQKVLPTIVSRCQRFEFTKLTLPEIVDKLESISKSEGVKAEKSAVELIAKTAEGSIRDAESLLDQVINLEDKEIKKEEVENILGVVGIVPVAHFVDFLIKKDKKGAIEYLENLTEKGTDIENFSKKLTSYLKDLLLIKISPQIFERSAVFTKEEKEFLRKQEKEFSEENLKGIVKIFLEAQSQIKWSDLPQLLLELAAMDAIEISNLKSRISPKESLRLSTGQAKPKTHI